MTTHTDDLPFSDTDAPLAIVPSEWLANGVHRDQFEVRMINGDDAIEFVCKLCRDVSTHHGMQPADSHFRPCPVFSIAARIGDGYNAADQEVVDRDGAFVWSGGSYNVRTVAYFHSRVTAELLAAKLDDGRGLVRVQWHDAGAAYVEADHLHAVIDLDADPCPNADVGGCDLDQSNTCPSCAKFFANYPASPPRYR